MPNVLVSLYDQFLKCSGGLQIFVWDKFMAGILVNVKATIDQKGNSCGKLSWDGGGWWLQGGECSGTSHCKRIVCNSDDKLACMWRHPHVGCFAYVILDILVELEKITYPKESPMELLHLDFWVICCWEGRVGMDGDAIEKYTMEGAQLMIITEVCKKDVPFLLEVEI